MQAPPECFPLPLIGPLFWVEAEVVPGSYRFQGLGKFRPAYLNQLRTGHSPKLFAQLFGQKPVLRREFHSESNSLRDRCGALFCPRRFRLGNVGRRYIHAGPLDHIAASRPIPRLVQLSKGFLARLDKLAFAIPDSAVKSLKDNLSGWPVVTVKDTKREFSSFPGPYDILQL